MKAHAAVEVNSHTFFKAALDAGE